MQHKPSSKEVPLWQIFTVFAKIGAFTIGGGYAMIPLIQAEMSRRGWISEDELPDIVALSQDLFDDGDVIVISSVAFENQIRAEIEQTCPDKRLFIIGLHR